HKTSVSTGAVHNELIINTRLYCSSIPHQSLIGIKITRDKTPLQLTYCALCCLFTTAYLFSNTDSAKTANPTMKTVITPYILCAMPHEFIPYLGRAI
ncbi:MAG: hypothetical protein ACRDC9_15890, partial [Plesiomonas shigelloides]